jgi:succinate dehydrogenase / fumarate reductase, cytochrome b subunit
MPPRIDGLASIGLKAVMAVTGLILVSFVIFHLYNNIHIYFGREVYNTDGFSWKRPSVISIVRPVMLASVLLHAIVGIVLAFYNRDARPEPYAVLGFKESTLLGRAMVFTGLVVGAYVVYHVLHAKVGTAHPGLFDMVDDEGRRDVYNIMVLSFRQPVISAAYIIGLGCLFLHTSHGITSIFSTLGILTDRNRRVGPIVSSLLFLGYASIPFSVWTGYLQPVM